MTWQSSCIIAKYIQKTLKSLSKLYNGTYYEVDDVIKYTQIKYKQKTSGLLAILTGGAQLISNCFV